MIETPRCVFISHILEESLVALVLQKYRRAAFGDTLTVFVSTDKESIPIGQQWITSSGICKPRKRLSCSSRQNQSGVDGLLSSLASLLEPMPWSYQ